MIVGHLRCVVAYYIRLSLAHKRLGTWMWDHERLVTCIQAEIDMEFVEFRPLIGCFLDILEAWMWIDETDSASLERVRFLSENTTCAVHIDACILEMELSFSLLTV